MTGLYHQLLRKQRAEREAKKAKERLARLRVQQGKEPTPEPEEASSGLDDLPDEIALVLAATPITAPPAPETPKREAEPPDSVENLVQRMTAIRERIWRLRALFATTLSQDCAIEANRFLQLFQDLAAQLKTKAPEQLEELVRGHESLLQSPPVLVKPTISIQTQHWCEIRAEAQRSRAPRTETRHDQIHDGLGAFL